MAVVTAFRIAIFLAGAGVRIVKWAEGPGVDTGARLTDSLRARLNDPSESDAALESALTAAGATLPDVATYVDPVGLRKMQTVWSFAGGSPGGEDVRVTTHHFLRIAAGVPSDAWVAGDFQAVETAWATLLTSGTPTLRSLYTSSVSTIEHRWYRAGQGSDPPNPPVRVTPSVYSGTGSASPVLPPQVAISVTEQTSRRSAWGRIYLPFNSALILGNDGRVLTANLTAIANAYDTFFETCKTAGLYPVVFSVAKDERPKKPSGTLPAQPHTAYSVDQVQVDDIPDVIRSRRHAKPVLRIQRAIA